MLGIPEKKILLEKHDPFCFNSRDMWVALKQREKRIFRPKIEGGPKKKHAMLAEIHERIKLNKNYLE